MARRSKLRVLISSIKETGEIPEVFLTISKISKFPIQEWTKKDLFFEAGSKYGREDRVILDNWLPYIKTELPRPQIRERIMVYYKADGPYAAEAEYDDGREHVLYFKIEKGKIRRILRKTFMKLTR